MKFVASLLLVVLAAAFDLEAQTIAVTERGDTVVLHPDGSYQKKETQKEDPALRVWWAAGILSKPPLGITLYPEFSTLMPRIFDIIDAHLLPALRHGGSESRCRLLEDMQRPPAILNAA